MRANTLEKKEIRTRTDLYEALRGNFKTDYLNRLLSRSDHQAQAQEIAKREGIGEYAAWYKLLTRPPRA